MVAEQKSRGFFARLCPCTARRRKNESKIVENKSIAEPVLNSSPKQLDGAQGKTDRTQTDRTTNRSVSTKSPMEESQLVRVCNTDKATRERKKYFKEKTYTGQSGKTFPTYTEHSGANRTGYSLPSDLFGIDRRPREEIEKDEMHKEEEAELDVEAILDDMLINDASKQSKRRKTKSTKSTTPKKTTMNPTKEIVSTTVPSTKYKTMSMVPKKNRRQNKSKEPFGKSGISPKQMGGSAETAHQTA